MQDKNMAQRGMLLLLVCATMWSISGMLIKLIPWHAIVIAGTRSLLAGCVMALYIKLSGMRFVFDKTAIISGVLISGMFIAFTLANKLTTAANAIVIQSSAPVFVLLYNVLRGGKRASRLDILTVLFTIIGISMFFFDQLMPGMLLGNFVALIAGILLAAVYIATCGAKQESCMNGILFAHGLTALIGIPMMLVFDTPVTGASVGGIMLLGIVQLGIPYILYGLAVQHCPPLACSLICMTEAIFNPIWVFLFSGESPSAFALLGGALVLATIAVWAVLSQRQKV